MMIGLLIASMFAAPDAEMEIARNDELRDYLIEAADRHPLLRARYESWLAALERVPQATALDDPMLSYTQFVQSDINRFNAKLMQKFPWFGTRKSGGSGRSWMRKSNFSSFTRSATNCLPMLRPLTTSTAFSGSRSKSPNLRRRFLERGNRPIPLQPGPSRNRGMSPVSPSGPAGAWSRYKKCFRFFLQPPQHLHHARRHQRKHCLSTVPGAVPRHIEGPFSVQSRYTFSSFLSFSLYSSLQL